MKLAWSVGGKGQGEASSGCMHMACFSGEAGSEVGSTVYKQTYYFAISEVYVDCWGMRERKSSLDRLPQRSSHCLYGQIPQWGSMPLLLYVMFSEQCCLKQSHLRRICAILLKDQSFKCQLPGNNYSCGGIFCTWSQLYFTALMSWERFYSGSCWNIAHENDIIAVKHSLLFSSAEMCPKSWNKGMIP